MENIVKYSGEIEYNAIIHMERPCAQSCGMDAIGSDDQGRAVINQDKCVACGQCLVSCPFGAIVDKAARFVEKYSKEAMTESPTDSPCRHVGESLD